MARMPVGWVSSWIDIFCHWNWSSQMIMSHGWPYISHDDDGNDADGNNDDGDFPQGDSGGPFTVADSGSGAHTLVGAVSFGVGCARVRSSYSLALDAFFHHIVLHVVELSIKMSKSFGVGCARVRSSSSSSIPRIITIAIFRRACTESMPTSLSSGPGSTRPLQLKEAPLSAHRVIPYHKSTVYR